MLEQAPIKCGASMCWLSAVVHIQWTASHFQGTAWDEDIAPDSEGLKNRDVDSRLVDMLNLLIVRKRKEKM